MNKESVSAVVDRGIALHQMIRLVTMATAGNGYLCFMGNEFGHPEWIDFPRAGNGWSYKYARRQWSLMKADYLRYRGLLLFDKEMLSLARQAELLSVPAELMVQDEEKKILIFRRKDCIFALNFNPVGSFADYGFAAPAGRWVTVLSTDMEQFSGFSRVRTGEEHFTLDRKSPNGVKGYDATLQLYLPSRTAVVLMKKD